MTMLCTIFVVLMLFWLFGGGYATYYGPNATPWHFGAYTLIPWICVAILGFICFNGSAVVTIR